MTQTPTVVLHLKEVATADDLVREAIEKRCNLLAEEFHEITRVEVSLEIDGAGVTAHAHVTGKNVDAGTHASAAEPGPAADLALDKVERQLRKVHDKRIFAQRREAQKDPPKRKA